MDRQVALLLLLSLFWVSCFDSFDTYVPSSSQPPVPNAHIANIHLMYEKGLRDISQDIVVRGVITANDEHGNLFKSCIIEEEGSALEILDGRYNSHILYPRGSVITLRLKGLRLDQARGVLRAGLPADTWAPYAVEYFTAQAIADLHITVAKGGEVPIPKICEIFELPTQQCGRLISMEQLQLLTEDGIERTWSGYALFRDRNLDSIWCYTSPYADFAGEKIPQHEISISGILEFGATESHGNQFIIKPHETPCH